MRQKNKTTAQVIHEYGELLTKYYLLALLVLLPLYHQDGYSHIANSKYILYRVLTTVFLIICGLICFAVETACEKGQNIKKKPLIPIVFVAVHLVSHLITWAFAANHELSWKGNGSWHMGLLTQLLFLCSMLLVYYYYSDSFAIWIAAAIGAGITSVLTVLNRFDIYPIDMGNKYPGFISTLGQTNWATLYATCLIGVGIGYYIIEDKQINRSIVLVLDGILMAGALVAGSDTVLPAMFAMFFIMFGVCLRKRELMDRFARVLLTLGIVMEIVYVLVFVLFHDSFVFVDEFDAVNTLLKKQAGIALIIVSLMILGAIHVTKEKEWKKEVLCNFYKVIVALSVVMLAVIIVLMVIVTNTPEKAGALANIRMLRFDDDWGTHRGLNWKCAAIGFLRMPPFGKLVGLGQGYFAPYMDSMPDLKARIEAMYEGFALVVAHNEYLNMLIENGILGCFSYIGILVTSFAVLWKKADSNRRALMALLALSGYIACSIFFFQHVYATSFMYIFVAIGLAAIRDEQSMA